MIKLSIITINFNNKAGLVKTVESVINQTYKDFEYIIIDGGSTDGSSEYIEEQQGHFDYWVSEPDNGIYDAMNKGIKVAQGEYCLFLNSGDYFFSFKSLDQFDVSKFESDLNYGNVQFESSGIIYDGKFTSNKLIKKNLCHQSVFYKRNVLIELGLFDLKYKIWADYVINIKIFLGQYETKFINQIITVFEDTGISSDCIDNNFINNYESLILIPFKSHISKKEIIKATYNQYINVLKADNLSFSEKLIFFYKVTIFSKSIGLFYLMLRRAFKMV